MSGQIEIIYAGRLSQGSVSHRFGGNLKHYSFRRGVPFRVPRALAEKLAKKPQYIVGALPFTRFHEDYDFGALLVRRFGALGDLIMLRAVVAALKKAVPQFWYGLTTQSRYAKVFQHDTVFEEVVEDTVVPRLPYLGELYLDGVVEVDHSGDPLSHVHRVKLFWEHLVKDLNLKLPTELDWDIPIGSANVGFANDWLAKRDLAREDRVRPLVGVQVRGSGKMKTLPPKEVVKLVGKLLHEDYDVLLIDQQPNTHLATLKGVYEAPGRSVLDVVALMKNLDAVICMDSGVLWLAHVAKLPTICLMGPTRPEERISLHPLYRDGLVTAVMMNDLVRLPGRTGCPACFENAKACSYTYACINQVSVDEYYGQISEDLRVFTQGRREGYANRDRDMSEVQV
jgi:hypothetical protein